VRHGPSVGIRLQPAVDGQTKETDLRTLAIALVLTVAAAGSLFLLHAGASGAAVRPTLEFPSVPGDADDCAIWLHPTDPAKSLIIGNDKDPDEKSGLHVYDLEGNELQFLPLGEASNVDVRKGMDLDGKSVDICVAVERFRRVPRVYVIAPESRNLRCVNADWGSYVRKNRPYGLALYKRPTDGAVFAFVSKLEKADIQQYRLVDNGTGRIAFRPVRQFGGSAMRTHVEGMVADDELGFLYASDEENAILKFRADPEASGEPVAIFARGDGIDGDREGIAIYKTSPTTGYLLVSSQGNSTVKIYQREGDNKFLKTIDTVGAYRTDGLDVTSHPLGKRFPHGLLVCHDSRDDNFAAYPWEAIAGETLELGFRAD
jgi:3-phytase